MRSWMHDFRCWVQKRRKWTNWKGKSESRKQQSTWQSALQWCKSDLEQAFLKVGRALACCNPKHPQMGQSWTPCHEKLAPRQSCLIGLKQLHQHTFISWIRKSRYLVGTHCSDLAALTVVTLWSIAKWFSFKVDLFHHFKNSNGCHAVFQFWHLPSSSQFQSYKNNKPIFGKHDILPVKYYVMRNAKLICQTHLMTYKLILEKLFPHSWWHQIVLIKIIEVNINYFIFCILLIPLSNRIYFHTFSKMKTSIWYLKN